jgi:hypothetical protein
MAVSQNFFLDRILTRFTIAYFLGETKEEIHSVEIECRPSSLRSRGCFLYLTSTRIHLWIGQGAPVHTIANARFAAQNFR